MAAMDDTQVIAPAPRFSIAGTAACVARSIDLRSTVITRSHSCSVVSMRSRRDSTPTLLCRMSSPPQRDSACSTIARHSAARVTSATKACAIPPSPSIAFTVSSARSSCASTQSTLAPSRAKRIEAALPLPMPGPREPAPVTMATLSFRRAAIKRSGGFGGFLVFALLLRLRGALLLLFLRLRRRRLFRAVHQHDEREGRVVALPETALEDAQVP